MNATCDIQTDGTGRCSFKHPTCEAELHLHGGHITHWQPAGEEPVIFLSPNAVFEPGRAIRGGVPICLPWFGPHPTNPKAPSHGLVRTMPWQLVEHRAEEDGWHVHLHCQQNRPASTYWTHPFTADLFVTFGRDLSMELRITNTGPAAFDFTEALHAYYRVGDVRQVTVTGLQETDYLDKTAGNVRKHETAAAIEFTQETDRAYVNTLTTCAINDPTMNRRIIVEKDHSLSTVVWNPFETLASQMSDLGSGNWQGFVCLETANAAVNVIRLEPGKSHAMSANVYLELLAS